MPPSPLPAVPQCAARQLLAPNKYLLEMHVALRPGIAQASCRCFVSQSPSFTLVLVVVRGCHWAEMRSEGKRGWQLEEGITEASFLGEIR